MSVEITCDLQALALLDIIKLLVEADGTGGIQLKTGASSSSAGVAGSLGLYTNLNDADFQVTVNAGGNTVDVTGAPFTVEAGNIASGIALLNEGGNWTLIPVTNVDVTGDTVTFGDYGGNFSATDEVILLMLGPTKAYDTDLNALLVSLLNATYTHSNSPEHVIDEVDLAEGAGYNGTGGAAGTGDNFYYLVPWDTFRNGTFLFLTTTAAGNTFTTDLLATNNPDADLVDIDEAGDGWIDLQGFLADVSQLTTAAGVTNQRDLWIVNEQLAIEYVLIRVVVVDGGTEDNAIDCWMKKAY